MTNERLKIATVTMSILCVVLVILIFVLFGNREPRACCVNEAVGELRVITVNDSDLHVFADGHFYGDIQGGQIHVPTVKNLTLIRCHLDVVGNCATATAPSVSFIVPATEACLIGDKFIDSTKPFIIVESNGGFAVKGVSA